MGDAIINPSNPQRIYSTTWGGGNISLISSNDYGSNWAGPQFPNPTDVYNINAPVCLNPKNPSKVYFATDNLYRSFDGGQSFIRKVNPDTNNLPNQAARAMAIATNDTQRIFIAYDQPDWYYTQSKLFSSPDGGTTWIHLNDIIPAITDFG